MCWRAIWWCVAKGLRRCGSLCSRGRSSSRAESIVGASKLHVTTSGNSARAARVYGARNVARGATTLIYLVPPAVPCLPFAVLLAMFSHIYLSARYTHHLTERNYKIHKFRPATSGVEVDNIVNDGLECYSFSHGASEAE